MSLIDEARKLQPTDVALTVSVFIATVAPGFLTIYLYKPSLVGTLDTFKLLLFCAALTLPFVSVNFICAASIKARDNQAPGFALHFSMAVTSIVLYLALLISYVFALPFRWHLGVLGFLQVVTLVFFYLVKHDEKKP